MQYCEEQFLAVASRYGLCRPPSSVLTLEDIISLHASLVRPSLPLCLRVDWGCEAQKRGLQECSPSHAPSHACARSQKLLVAAPSVQMRFPGSGIFPARMYHL